MRDVQSRLRRFPWATFGRPEPAEDLFRKVAAQAQRSPLMAYAPRFSVVITVPPGTRGSALDDLFASLQAQSYPHWEAVLVAPAGLGNLGEPRARLVPSESDAPEAARKNAGAAVVTGEWLLFLDADDVLNPCALYQFALAMQGEKPPSFLYANETRLAPGDKAMAELRSKPEPSPFNLLHFNYIGKPWTVRASAFRDAGGFRESAGGHHEHDLFLRLYSEETEFRALPTFLVHRRREWFPEADGVLERVVAEHMERESFSAATRVATVGDRQRLKITPALPDEPARVSAIICFRDRAEWTERCLEALAVRVGSVPVEVLLVDNGSTPRERERVEAKAKATPIETRVLRYDAPFNYARMHNWVVQEHATGNFLFLLNNDVFLEGTWTLDEMVAWAAQPCCGTVGIQLKYPHGGVQHGGFRARFGGEARVARVAHEQNEDLFTHESRETFGSTFAASVVRKDTFQAIGGLRELDLPNGFGDVVFNFECLKRGLTNIYLGHLEGLHLESASRGNDYEYWEECIVEGEYPELLQKMLRYDLGLNRAPGADFSFKTLARQAVHGALEKSAPRLLPVKAKVKKTLLGLKQLTLRST